MASNQGVISSYSPESSSGATVISWMIQFNLFLLFCFVLWDFCCCFCCCGWPVCWCVLSNLCWCHCFGFFLFCFFSSFVSLFLVLERSAVFILMWVGVGWSYNHLLVGKLICLILELYINLNWSVTGKFGCNLRELFITLYISNICY